MFRTFLAALTGLILAAPTVAMAKPIDCHVSAERWWTRQLDKFVNTGGQYGVNPALSLPAVGIAHVTWDDGTTQLVTVAPVEGLGVCVTERTTVAAVRPAISPRK
jgi:hypothetical protein